MGSPPPSLPESDEEEALLSGALDETATLPADLGQSGFDVVPQGQHVIVEDEPHPRCG